MSNNALKTVAPLPRVPAEWVRKTELNRTLNDQVEDIHLRLLDREDYLKLLEAVYDEQAVEGSLSADNTMAAVMIRNEARKIGNAKLAGEKLATISKALTIVLRRYGVSRKERRGMIGGEAVSTGNDD